MENIYATNKKKCELVKAKPETIQFLLDYSKSLHFVEKDGIVFQSNLN